MVSHLKIIIVILILAAFSGCSEYKEKPVAVTLKSSKKIITFTLDDNTSNISDGLFYYSNPNFLFSLNWLENSIQIFDVGSKKRIKNLKFDYEGPNGVLDIFGIHVHNLDSIFLFNQLQSEITLIDTSGTIKNKFHYQTPENYSPAFVHNSYFRSQPIINGNKMIVKTHFYGPLQKMTQKELTTKEVIYEIDLVSGKTRFLDFPFPSDYMIDGLKLFEASISHGAGKYVYSLFGDHRLFYVSEFGDSLVSKNGKSEFLSEDLPLFPIQGDGLDFRKYSYYSPHYESLEYDAFREVFIRFAFHSFEQNDSVPVSDMRNHSGSFSIQIFDKDLNLISETPFEANHYNPFDYFITEEGLFLSINHPLNPLNQEDLLSFELIEYVQKESIKK